VVPEQYIVKHA